MPNENYPHADAAKQNSKGAGANPKDVKSVSQPDGTAANAPRGETQAQPRSNQAIDPSATTRGTEGGENRPQAQQGTNSGQPQNTGSDQNRYEAKGDRGEKGVAASNRSQGQGQGKDQEFGEAVDIGQDNHGLGKALNPEPNSDTQRNFQSKVPTGKGGHNPTESRPGKEGASAERGAPESETGRPNVGEKDDEEAA
jgi:hypothetical protein